MLTRGRRARVLRDINAIRERLEQPPIDWLPLGRPRSAGCCPLARALCAVPSAVAVGRDFFTVHRLDADEWISDSLTTVLCNFVRDFDRGLIPELIEP